MRVTKEGGAAGGGGGGGGAAVASLPRVHGRARLLIVRGYERDETILNIRDSANNITKKRTVTSATKTLESIPMRPTQTPAGLQ